MKNVLFFVCIGIVLFIFLTLLIAFVTGPFYMVVCKTWGQILGFNTDYPNCWKHWWR